MQHESHSHGIDIGALGRKKQTLDLASEPVALEVPGLNLFYGDKQALFDVSLNIPKNRVTAFIGPSGCGKSTLLRTFNRMNDLVDGCRVDGEIRLDGHDIYARNVDVAELRRRVGMVFQKPNPFPKSIYENVVYGLRLQGINQKRVLDETVEWALKSAALWDEVKDRLHTLGTRLSGGQQQRLTIARALSHDPEILCLDEFSIAIDPVTTMRIEDVLLELRNHMTIVLVTNLVQQARRLAGRTAFFNKGAVVQEDATDVIFSDDPGNTLTYEYVHGIFG